MGYRLKRTPEEYEFETLSFDIQILDKHFTELADRDVLFAVAHHMTIIGKGTGSALDACYQTWQNRRASAQYGVDGKLIRQFVWDKDYAWAAGSSYGNLYGTHVEHANSKPAPTWEVGDDTWMTGAKLMAAIHMVEKLGRPTTVGFGEGGTLRSHGSFYATACPGPFFKTIWGAYYTEVVKQYLILTGATVPKPPSTATTYTVIGGDTLWAISRKFDISVEDLALWNGLSKPYILPIGFVLSLVAKKPTAVTAVWGDPDTFVEGAVGPDAVLFGERIQIWSRHEGLADPYTVGPSSPLGPTDFKGLQQLQMVWGYGSEAKDLTRGGNSDGYPGTTSFGKLILDPPKSPEPKPPPPPPAKKTTVPLLHWNIAGSDKNNGYGASNHYRGEPLGRYAKKIGFDVFLTCEASQTDLRKGVSTGLGITSWMQRAKAVWFTDNVSQIRSNKAYSDNIFAYLSTLKWGAAFFGEKNGKKFAVLEIHTDYRAPAKQAKQVQTIYKKFLKDCDNLGVPRVNQFICGDFNWDGSSGDNPFKALSDWGFEEKGSRTVNTFMERKHLDGVLAQKNSSVKVSVKPRDDGNMRLSDHNPIQFTPTLQ